MKKPSIVIKWLCHFSTPAYATARVLHNIIPALPENHNWMRLLVGALIATAGVAIAHAADRTPMPVITDFAGYTIHAYGVAPIFRLLGAIKWEL